MPVPKPTHALRRTPAHRRLDHPVTLRTLPDGAPPVLHDVLARCGNPDACLAEVTSAQRTWALQDVPAQYRDQIVSMLAMSPKALMGFLPHALDVLEQEIAQRFAAKERFERLEELRSAKRERRDRDERLADSLTMDATMDARAARDAPIQDAISAYMLPEHDVVIRAFWGARRDRYGLLDLDGRKLDGQSGVDAYLAELAELQRSDAALCEALRDAPSFGDAFLVLQRATARLVVAVTKSMLPEATMPGPPRDLGRVVADLVATFTLGKGRTPTPGELARLRTKGIDLLAAVPRPTEEVGRAEAITDPSPVRPYDHDSLRLERGHPRHWTRNGPRTSAAPETRSLDEVPPAPTMPEPTPFEVRDARRTEREKKILRLLRRSPGLSGDDIRTRLSMGKAQAVQALDALVTAGAIENRGTPTNPKHYVVSKVTRK